MRLTKKELEDAAGILFDALCTGITDEDAMDDLGVDREVYETIRAKMFDVHAEEIRKRPTEHVYVQYILDQTANIRDLTTMVAEFKSTKQYNAMVGAIKARSELQDKLITRGQEFGFIAKTPQRKQIVAGIVITDMTNVELKRSALRELRELNRLMSEVGEMDLLEVAPGPVYRGPALPPAVEPARDEPIVITTAVERKKKRSKKQRM